MRSKLERLNVSAGFYNVALVNGMLNHTIFATPAPTLPPPACIPRTTRTPGRMPTTAPARTTVPARTSDNAAAWTPIGVIDLTSSSDDNDNRGSATSSSTDSSIRRVCANAMFDSDSNNSSDASIHRVCERAFCD